MEQVSKVSRSWSKEEDDKLRRQINAEANQNWKNVAIKAGLKRSANSCRLRYINHLKPRTRPGKLTDEEKLLSLEFRNQYGKNRWAEITKHLRRGRRDNDVKNYWHSEKKRAKREGHDVERYASRKRAELVEKIRAAGKFSMDYSSSISADAFEKLKELFPDLAAAGGGAVAEVAVSSSFTGAVALASDLRISNDLASSSAATDIRAADAVTSCYSVEFGPGQVHYGDVSKFEPTAEVDLGFNFSSTPPTEISNPEQLLDSWLVDDGGGPTGLNQVQAAAFQMQGSEYSTLAGPQQQLAIINSEDLYLGGDPAEFNQATVAADAVTSCYSVEFGPGQVHYGDVSKFEPTAEVDLGFNFSSTPPTEISNPEQLLDSWLVDDGGGPTCLNQVQAGAFQMQGSEYTPAGPQQQLAIINSEDLYLGGDPAEFNQATVAADAVTSCYSVEFGPELVEMINDREWSRLISSDAYDLPEEMFPDIAGGAADSSPTDGELNAGTPGRVEHTVFSPYVATTEVDQLTPDVETPQSRGAVERHFQKGFTTRSLYYGGDPGAAPGFDPVPEAEPVQQQLVKTGLFHRPTGFNQLPAALGIASTETSNQTSHMQVEQQGLNGGCLDHGGGPAEFNQATVAALHNIGKSDFY